MDLDPDGDGDPDGGESQEPPGPGLGPGPGPGPEPKRERRASVWARYWMPFADFKSTSGTDSQRAEARRFNARWMKQWGSTYVKRWFISFALAHWVVAFAHDVDEPFLIDISCLMYYLTMVGLVAIVYFNWTVSRVRKPPSRE